MADKFVISGVGDLDGEYEIEDRTYTNRELHTIKRLSGVRVGELEDALKAGDNDLTVALAIVTMQRKGKAVDEDAVWDAEMGSVRWVPDLSLRGDASPPEQTMSGEPPGSNRSSNGGSGAGSSSGSESPESIPTPIGTPASATQPISDPETSAT